MRYKFLKYAKITKKKHSRYGFSESIKLNCVLSKVAWKQLRKEEVCFGYITQAITLFHIAKFKTEKLLQFHV